MGLIKVFMDSRDCHISLVKILGYTTESRYGDPSLHCFYNDCLRTGRVPRNQGDINAWKQTSIAGNRLERNIFEKGGDIKAGKVGMGIQGRTQLLPLNEYGTMGKKVEKGNMIKMQMGKYDCIYILDSKIKPVQIFFKAAEILNGRHGTGCIAGRITSCIHKYAAILIPDKECTVKYLHIPVEISQVRDIVHGTFSPCGLQGMNCVVSHN